MFLVSGSPAHVFTVVPYGVVRIEHLTSLCYLSQQLEHLLELVYAAGSNENFLFGAELLYLTGWDFFATSFTTSRRVLLHLVVSNISFYVQYICVVG